MDAGGSKVGRRRFLAAAGLTVGATALAGCGSGSSPAPAPAGPAPAAAGFPVTVTGVEGSVTLSAPPTRVVSVGQFRDTDAAVALGVVPLATPDISRFIPSGVSPWLREALAGQAPPERFAIPDGLPLERIAGLRPDLILGTDSTALADEYAQLAAIAPTLSTESGYNKDAWQVTTTRVGKVLGRPDPAAALIAQVEGAIAAARADHPQFAGRTFTIGPVQADGTVTTINSATDASVVFLSQLGLTLSPSVTGLPTGPIPGRAPVSAERLSVIDADVLILTYNTAEAQQRMEANPVFQRIPAVRAGRYVALDLPTAIAIAFPSALSIPYALKVSVPKIAAAPAR